MTKKTKKSGGVRFTKKYGVADGTVYSATGATQSVKIPPAGHFLYDATSPTVADPLMVAQIDADGHMTSALEVWCQPDTNTLWILDGRCRFRAVTEVNRRRAAEGRELVEPLLVPFRGTEQQAIARVRIRNYHRRTPTVSGMACDLLVLRNAGYSWHACAQSLHQTQIGDHEQWGKRLVVLAYCEPEVQAAIDAGELPRTLASKFGGTAVDGSKKLSRGQQLELLREMQAERESGSKDPKGVSAKARDRVTAALTNGITQRLKPREREDAALVAATLARVGGDIDALSSWPELAAIFDEAIKPPRPKRQEAAAEAAAEA